MKITNLKGYAIPKIYMKYDVMMKVKKLVDEVNIEVGFIYLVDKIEDNTYVIYDVFVPEQDAHGATCELKPEALLNIAHQIAGSEPEKLNHLRGWGHSHVNMDPSPSAQDEEQAMDFFDDADYLIRQIVNKKGEQTLSLFDFNNKLRYDKLELEILYTEEMQDLIDKMNAIEVKEEEGASEFVESIKGNIRTKTYSKGNYTKTSKPNTYNSGYYYNDFYADTPYTDYMSWTEEDVISLFTSDEILGIASLKDEDIYDGVQEYTNCTLSEAIELHESCVAIVKNGGCQ